MTNDNHRIRRLILASGSPRRRQLLSLLGFSFVVKAVGIDESPHSGETPTQLVARVSQAKARAVTDTRDDELIIAADTIVVLDGRILGKPVDANDAVLMLSALRDRAHVVYSGVSVWHPSSRKMVYELGETTVWMRDYSHREITAYVDSKDPLDKAGAYAIQSPVFDPVSRIDGCWLSVMGLPLCQLERALAEFGVLVPTDVPGSCQAFNQRSCPIATHIRLTKS